MLPLPPFIPAKRRVRRKRRATEGPPPVPPAPLTLVGASYDPGEVTLTLVFDRAVNIDAYNGGEIRVDDDEFNHLEYRGLGGASLSGPATVLITLVDDGNAPSGTPTLNASDLTGIVAADDGGTWIGVNDLELPFPTPPAREINQVVHGAQTQQVLVTVGWPLMSVDDVASALRVSVDGVTWRSPVTVELIDPTHAVFTFTSSVETCTMWGVPNPGNWAFDPSGALEGATDGEIG